MKLTSYDYKMLQPIAECYFRDTEYLCLVCESKHLLYGRRMLVELFIGDIFSTNLTKKYILSEGIFDFISKGIREITREIDPRYQKVKDYLWNRYKHYSNIRDRIESAAYSDNPIVLSKIYNRLAKEQPDLLEISELKRVFVIFRERIANMEDSKLESAIRQGLKEVLKNNLKSYTIADKLIKLPSKKRNKVIASLLTRKDFSEAFTNDLLRFSHGDFSEYDRREFGRKFGPILGKYIKKNNVNMFQLFKDDLQFRNQVLKKFEQKEDEYYDKWHALAFGDKSIEEVLGNSVKQDGSVDSKELQKGVGVFCKQLLRGKKQDEKQYKIALGVYNFLFGAWKESYKKAKEKLMKEKNIQDESVLSSFSKIVETIKVAISDRRVGPITVMTLMVIIIALTVASIVSKSAREKIIAFLKNLWRIITMPFQKIRRFIQWFLSKLGLSSTGTPPGASLPVASVSSTPSTPASTMVAGVMT